MSVKLVLRTTLQGCNKEMAEQIHYDMTTGPKQQQNGLCIFDLIILMYKILLALIDQTLKTWMKLWKNCKKLRQIRDRGRFLGTRHLSSVYVPHELIQNFHLRFTVKRNKMKPFLNQMNTGSKLQNTYENHTRKRSWTTQGGKFRRR